MEIITKLSTIEMIKPSSPTPKSLQKHQLSFLDQAMPPIYVPFVYFYASNPKIPNPKKINQLKKSLSEILTRFYPLAGRHVGNLYVDCNDCGVPFLEAEADCDLSHAIPLKNTQLLNKFLPYELDELHHFCMAAQATYFRCGGLAVGIIISHKIADAVSFIFFANAWSAVARNESAAGLVPPPKFDAAAYFPPLADTSVLDPTAVLTKEEVTVRVFRFPAATISLLRGRYTGGGGERPSRVEALSAFIWTQFVSATRARSDPNRMHYIYHPINLRNHSPLYKNLFGNVFVTSTAKAAAGDGGVEVVQKIREAMKAVSVTNNVSEENSMENVDWFAFSSLCGFSLYEADFGWGTPLWVGLARFALKDTVFLFDTKSGGGIEAFIQMTKQDMDKFEPHLKLQMLKSNL